MDSKIKKIAAGVARAGALTVGVAGTAFAADSSTSGTSAPSTQTANGHPRIQAEFRRGAIKVVADTLGVSRQDLRTALKRFDADTTADDSTDPPGRRHPRADNAATTCAHTDERAASTRPRLRPSNPTRSTRPDDVDLPA